MVPAVLSAVEFKYEVTDDGPVVAAEWDGQGGRYGIVHDVHDISPRDEFAVYVAAKVAHHALAAMITNADAVPAGESVDGIAHRIHEIEGHRVVNLGEQMGFGIRDAFRSGALTIVDYPGGWPAAA